MSIVRSALGLEKRATPFDSSALTIPLPGSSGGWSSSGTPVNDATALSIITFFAGVRIISDAVSTTPLRAVTVQGDGTRKPVNPSPEQIVDPFQAASLSEGLSQLVTSLILRGNAYAFVVARDPQTFKPLQVRVLHPDQVNVSWDDYGFRQYTISGKTFGGDQVIHLTSFMLPNALKGCGVIEYCRNALGIGIALEDVAGQFFRNGILSTGMISTDVPLTDDQARQAAEQFASRHSGTTRSFKPIVLGGGAKYTPMSLTLEDAQFIESRQFTEGQMATLLGIPPHLLGIVDKTTSWGTGIEVQGRAFVDYALRSYFIRFQNMFTAMLQDGMFAEFITDAITRADTETRYKNYSAALGNGSGPAWMNLDEVRAAEGLPPLPDGRGQIYYVPAAFVSTDDAITEITGPAAPLPPTDPSTSAPSTGST